MKAVWYQQRADRIAGLIIQQVYHTSVKNPSRSLIKKICQVNTSKLNTPAVAWGRDHEELTIKLYTDVSSNKNSQFKSKRINDVVIHTDLDVKSFGLQVSPEKLRYGASPDSVTCCCCRYGCLEVKCPLSLKDKSLKEEIHKGAFYVTYDSGSEIYELDRDHQYYFKVQLEIYILKVEFCNFMVWIPMEFLIIRIGRDDEFILICLINVICFGLIQFYQNC